MKTKFRMTEVGKSVCNLYLKLVFYNSCKNKKLIWTNKKLFKSHYMDYEFKKIINR